MPQLSWEEAVQWLRRQPDKQELVRACFFDDPLLDAAKRFHDCAEWGAVREFLPSAKGTALDVGAGRGIASFALAEDGWDVTALEPDPSDLVGAGAIAELSASSGHSIRIVREWGETLPFADSSFDLVHARQVLHHARDLGQFCKELTRVLKPGGVFIATREHVIDLPEELEIFRAHHALHGLYGGECAYALEHYLNAISRAGLLLQQVLLPFQSPINYYPATSEEIAQRAKEAWPWSFSMHPEEMLAQLDRTQTFPGRLYTFVAKRPLPEMDAVETLQARIVTLEARMHAREIALAKRYCVAATSRDIVIKCFKLIKRNSLIRCFRKPYERLRRFCNIVH